MFVRAPQVKVGDKKEAWLETNNLPIREVLLRAANSSALSCYTLCTKSTKPVVLVTRGSQGFNCLP